jgi:ABC-2 type transport system permease protein
MVRLLAAIAAKDLRVLSRIPSALFFSLAWPLLMAILFGTIFGDDSERPPIGVAVVDEDATPAAARLVQGIATREGLAVRPMTRDAALDAVRRGRLAGAVVVPKGYGDAAKRLFFGEPPRVELLIDPSRKAERAMLEGLLLEQGARRFQDTLSATPEGRQNLADTRAMVAFAPPGTIAGAEHLDQFLGELGLFLDANAAKPGSGDGSGGGATSPGLVPMRVDATVVERRDGGPTSAYAVTFPQGILWGAIGCALSFVVGLVGERTQGTLLRLRVAPQSLAAILLGKAVACGAALLLVQAAVLAVGVALFGVHPQSWLLLAVTGLFSTTLFVGLVLFIASLARTEQAASGAGWALFLPLAMLGGAMVPLAFMPAWLARLSNFSPFKWVLLAYEGTIWRGFDLAEIAPAWAVLAAIGLAAGTAGILRMRRASHV